LRFVKELLGALNAQLRLGMLWEPPGADPHAGWGLGEKILEKIPQLPA
jgi:hypothetical protein